MLKNSHMGKARMKDKTESPGGWGACEEYKSPDSKPCHCIVLTTPQELKKALPGIACYYLPEWSLNLELLIKKLLKSTTQT